MASMLHNISEGITKKLKQMRNPYKKFHISWMDLRLLKNKPKQSLYKQKFLNGYIQFYGALEFLHGVKEIFIDGIYDLKTGSNPKIIDCGGHIGLSAIYFKYQHPGADIVVFEPDPRNFQMLQENIRAQGYENNIELRNEAVWIEHTELTFFSDASMSSRIATGNESDIVKVKAFRLRDLLTEEVDLLKLDIEGAEYQVLKDIKDKFHLLKNIFIEYHGDFDKQNELVEILGWVADAGFKFYIKEACNVYAHPFNKNEDDNISYDVQLNIFCFR
ncbi:MAG TPA: FkbM family methyltransferase [Niabella sp.]|nr:FkbM family methyltransferase [Niabella sp.]